MVARRLGSGAPGTPHFARLLCSSCHSSSPAANDMAGFVQEDQAERGEGDESKGVEMAGDFDGSLHDMQADPEADDQEQEEEGQERMDQVPPPSPFHPQHHFSWDRPGA